MSTYKVEDRQIMNWFPLFAVFLEPHYQAIHSQADDLRGLDPQALTRLFKRSNGIIRYGNE